MPSKPRQPSVLEMAFDVAVTLERFPPYEPEYRFHSRRRWRFDFAWPDRKIAVELEGGIFTQGRHVRPTGFIEDCRKYNTAAIFGWLVLRFTPGDVENGVAIQYLRAAFRVRPASVQLSPQGGTRTHVRRTEPLPPTRLAPDTGRARRRPEQRPCP